MVGVNAVIFQTYPLEMLIERLEKIGINKLELSLGTNTEKYGRSVRNYLATRGMEVIAYSGGWGFEDLPYISGNMERSVKALENNIKIASALGASYMTVAEDIKPEGMSDEKAWECMITSYSKAVAIAKRYDIILVNEFHPGFVAGTPEKAIRLVDDIDSPNFKGCLDLCHADFMTGGHTREFIKLLGERIGYMHLSDITGVRYMHMPLGEGTLDVMGCIDAVKDTGYNGLWSLCLFGYPLPEDAVKKSMEWLEKNGVEL